MVAMAKPDEPWVIEHHLAGFLQLESRPGPVDEQGDRWKERRATGLVLYLCPCGLDTGWVARDQVPDLQEHM